jgi:hypothetical protein
MLKSSLTESSLLPITLLAVLACGCSPTIKGADRETDTPVETTADASSAVQPEPKPSVGKADASPSPTAFIGRARNQVAVPNIALPGKLAVDNGCLVVISEDGSRATAVFPRSATTEMEGNALIAIMSEGKRYPLNRTVIIGGGGVDQGDVQLVEPVPPSCPNSLYGIGG